MEIYTQLVYQPLLGNRLLESATENIVPFLFNNYSDLPSALNIMVHLLTFMSLVRHFTLAHAGAWRELVNVGSELTVGLGTEKYNVGILTATNVNVWIWCYTII